MVTYKGSPPDLRDATALTRQGRLLEATALIQRMLGGAPAFGGPPAAPAPEPGDVIDVECFEVPRRAEARLPSGRREARDDDAPRGPGRDRREQHEGEFVAGVFSNPAGARPYKLYLPTAYASQPLPLVVMLHGCTQTPDDFAQGTRMNTLAEERPCLVLYPEQTAGANRSRCWNWFRRGDQRRDHGEPAILAAMTRDVMRRYHIDPRRVYVAGMSAGGAMAAVMGAAYPELFAAIGVHSGLACGSAHDLPSALAAMRGAPAAASGSAVALPTIVFHGDRDKTVHPRNGEHVVAQPIQRAGGAGADTTTERGAVPGGRAYTRTLRRDAAGRVVVEHWLVHGGGHAWFGGSPRGTYVDPKGPDASGEMLRFFLENAAERNAEREPEGDHEPGR